MGFRVKHGSIDTIAKLGALAGQAQFEQKKQAVALDIAMKLRDEQQRADMAEFSAKLQVDSQKAQQAWEFQKIQMSQQHDFEMQESIRMQNIQLENDKDQRQRSKYEAAFQAIDDSEILSDTEKEKLKTNTSLKFNMGPYAAQLEDSPTAMDAMKMQRSVEDDIAYYQDTINRYSTTEDLNWIPFSGGRGAGDLAKKDAAGNWSPATEQDKAIYDYSRTQLALKLQMLNSSGTGPGGMQGGPGDVLNLGGI